jgi:hypothetical protein
MTKQFFFVLLMRSRGPALQAGVPGTGANKAVDSFDVVFVFVGVQVTTISQPLPVLVHVVPPGQHVPSGVPQSTAPGIGQQAHCVPEKGDLAHVALMLSHVVLYLVSHTEASAMAAQEISKRSIKKLPT